MVAGPSELQREAEPLLAGAPDDRDVHRRSLLRGYPPTVPLGGSTNALSNVVELAVGVACLLAGGGLWPRAGVRWAAVLLVIAGLAASIHAVAAIV